jgi:hypothetical protein
MARGRPSPAARIGFWTRRRLGVALGKSARKAGRFCVGPSLRRDNIEQALAFVFLMPGMASAMRIRYGRRKNSFFINGNLLKAG